MAAACAPSSLQVGREAPDPTRPPARPASLWEGVLGSRACPVLHQPCFICYFCLIHHKGPGTCVRGIRDVVLCFTMLNGQTPFVCFLFNSVFVRTIFSEAALINNGCAAHVSTLLIFYAATAPTMLSALLRLKAFVPQSGGAVAAPPLAGGRAWRALGAAETGQAAGPLQRPVWAVSAGVVPGPALSPGLWGRSEGSLPHCCSSPGSRACWETVCPQAAVPRGRAPAGQRGLVLSPDHSLQAQWVIVAPPPRPQPDQLEKARGLAVLQSVTRESVSCHPGLPRVL